MRKLVACAGIAALMCLPLACAGEAEESRPAAVSTQVSSPQVTRYPKIGDPINVGEMSVTVLGSVANPGDASGVEVTPSRGHRIQMIVIEVTPIWNLEVCGDTWLITRVYDGVGAPYKPLPLETMPENPACGTFLEAKHSEQIVLLYEVPIGRTILEWGVASRLDPKPKTVDLPAS